MSPGSAILRLLSDHLTKPIKLPKVELQDLIIQKQTNGQTNKQKNLGGRGGGWERKIIQIFPSDFPVGSTRKIFQNIFSQSKMAIRGYACLLEAKLFSLCDGNILTLKLVIHFTFFFFFHYHSDLFYLLLNTSPHGLPAVHSLCS